MHELPVTQGLCDLVVREADRAKASKVCSITVKMGAACDYVPEILQEYFDVLSEGTVANGAKLQIETVPITMRCNDCNKEYETPHYNPFCPQCSGNHTSMITGNEFYVDNIEIEEE
ncbi:MAG: hydrogenase maturation nickel metallochaperone HypA [Lachnospira sp.]